MMAGDMPDRNFSYIVSIDTFYRIRRLSFLIVEFFLCRTGRFAFHADGEICLVGKNQLAETFRN